jgi:alkylation response protein AidB-like acyl-CoA dehydrogenase
MRFDLTEEQELVRETARRFLESEADITAVRCLFDEPAGFSTAYWKRVGELGWLSLAASDEAGGYSASGRRGQDLSIIAEEIGRRVAPGPFAPTGVVLQALATATDGVDRNKLASEILRGDVIATWAFGEPGARWDPQKMTVTATLADGEVTLNGVKAYVEAGAEAQVMLVTARSEAGPTQVLVPADAAGLTVIPGRSLDFVRRFAEVRLDNVRLPRSAVVGGFGGASAAVERQLQLALLLQAAETNGALERAFEFTVDYMRDRYAFGRPIASYQALKHRLADNLLWIHSGMATTDAAVDAFDATSPDTPRLARIAKVYVALKSSSIISDFVQLTGGIGVTWDYDLHLYERRIAVNRAVFGTPEFHRPALFQILAGNIEGD